MVTPWKKLGEAGILVWLALFLALRWGPKYSVVSSQGYNNMGLHNKNKSRHVLRFHKTEIAFKVCIYFCCLLLPEDLFVFWSVSVATPKQAGHRV